RNPSRIGKASARMAMAIKTSNRVKPPAPWPAGCLIFRLFSTTVVTRSVPLLLNTGRKPRPSRGRDRLQQRPDPLENGERLRRIDTIVRDADRRRHGLYEDAHDIVVPVGQMHDCWSNPTVRVEENVY